MAYKPRSIARPAAETQRISPEQAAEAEARIRYLDFRFIFDFNGHDIRSLQIHPRHLPPELQAALQEAFLARLKEITDGSPRTA